MDHEFGHSLAILNHQWTYSPWPTHISNQQSFANIPKNQQLTSARAVGKWNQVLFGTATWLATRNAGSDSRYALSKMMVTMDPKSSRILMLRDFSIKLTMIVSSCAIEIAQNQLLSAAETSDDWRLTLGSPSCWQLSPLKINGFPSKIAKHWEPILVLSCQWIGTAVSLEIFTGGGLQPSRTPKQPKMESCFRWFTVQYIKIVVWGNSMKLWSGCSVVYPVRWPKHTTGDCDYVSIDVCGTDWWRSFELLCTFLSLHPCSSIHPQNSCPSSKSSLWTHGVCPVWPMSLRATLHHLGWLVGPFSAPSYWFGSWFIWAWPYLWNW